MLEVVFAYRKTELTELVKSERDWFSDVSFLDAHLNVMVQFFRDNPSIFPLLNDALKTPLQNYAALSLDHFGVCWFISANPETHINEILRKIDAGERMRNDIFTGLCASLGTTDAVPKALYIGIKR